MAKEQARVVRFGEVRPVLHTGYRGYKLVAVGSEIHWSKNWKTFSDFLLDYIKHVLSPEWGKAELEKPFEDRHPISSCCGKPQPMLSSAVCGQCS